MAEFDSQFEEDMYESFYGWIENAWVSGQRTVYNYGDPKYQRQRAAAWPDEWPAYEGSEDPFEQFLYTAGSRTGSGYRDQSMDIQGLMSSMVINPMGRSIDTESGMYAWGDLAYIYQMTPSGDVARQVQAYRASGQNTKADYLENAYSNTKRTEGEDLGAIRQLSAKYGHGQTDVEMNPDLVNQMLYRRTTDRTRRQYKGGTVHAGLLTSPALGFKKTLGG